LLDELIAEVAMLSDVRSARTLVATGTSARRSGRRSKAERYRMTILPVSLGIEDFQE
jgi:hypothetical protein